MCVVLLAPVVMYGGNDAWPDKGLYHQSMVRLVHLFFMCTHFISTPVMCLIHHFCGPEYLAFFFNVWYTIESFMLECYLKHVTCYNLDNVTGIVVL